MSGFLNLLTNLALLKKIFAVFYLNNFTPLFDIRGIRNQSDGLDGDLFADH